MLLHRSRGILRYSIHEDVGHKLIVEVSPGIVSLVRALMPPYIYLNPTRYAPHISVVRHERPVNIEAWGKYNGQPVEFEYTNQVHNGRVYWWLNAFSTRLEKIRVELGLPVSSQYTRPPEGYVKCFHMTIGNVKEAGPSKPT